MRATGHSIWLMPEDAMATRLNTRIKVMAAASDTALFPAHVTLLGRITGDAGEIAQEVGDLAARHPPIEFTLGPRGGQPSWFRCLYLEVERTAALMSLHRDACEALGQAPAGFQPHLSLRYGTMNEPDRVRAVSEPDPENGTRFRATALHLWSTEGPVNCWQEVGRFPLG